MLQAPSWRLVDVSRQTTGDKSMTSGANVFLGEEDSREEWHVKNLNKMRDLCWVLPKHWFTMDDAG